MKFRILVLTKSISNLEGFAISPSLIRNWATSRYIPTHVISNNVSLGYTTRCRSDRHWWGGSSRWVWWRRRSRGGSGRSDGPGRSRLRSGRAGAGDTDSQFLAQGTMSWKGTKVVMWSSRSQCNVCWPISGNWNWACSIAWIKICLWYLSHTMKSRCKVKYCIRKKRVRINLF